MSGELRVDSIADGAGTGSPSFPTAPGNSPVYFCRAWVNFDGTGTVSIRESGNVSSITDNGTGDYTVNFATAMPDNDYSTVGTAGALNSDVWNFADTVQVGVKGTSNFIGQYTTSGVSILISSTNLQPKDRNLICFSVFR